MVVGSGDDGGRAMRGESQEDDRRIPVLRAVQACEAFIEVFRPLGSGRVNITDHSADLAIAGVEDLAVLLKQTGMALRELCHD
jgi:hypothetical protein